jgi:hypothetical protein
MAEFIIGKATRFDGRESRRVQWQSESLSLETREIMVQSDMLQPLFLERSFSMSLESFVLIA